MLEFCKVNVYADSMVMEAVRLHGKVIDSFSVNTQAPELMFIQAADPQIGWAMCGNMDPLWASAISKVNMVNPAFLVVTGDLVDNRGVQAQVDLYKAGIAQLKPVIPIYQLPGNHDIGDTPDTTSYALWKSRFVDQKLRLRSDHWSAGAALCRHPSGVASQIFRSGGGGFWRCGGAQHVGRQPGRASPKTGASASGRNARQKRKQANQPAQRGERHDQRRVAEVQAISGQANLSTDGAMMLVRGEGWKEVKVVAVSEVQVRPAAARPHEPPSRRDDDPLVELSRHSYQAGLWDADTMAQYQYAEGLRRGIDLCRKLSSVNDGAIWIKRITATNFSHAQQIVDWRHASDHLWAVANAVCGEHTAQARQWTEEHLDFLWNGQVASRSPSSPPLSRPGR